MVVIKGMINEVNSVACIVGVLQPVCPSFDFHEPPVLKLGFDVKVELGPTDCNFDLEANLGLNLN